MASTPHVSPRRAAGNPPINTVGAPGGMMGVGTPEVAVLTIGSVTRAAGNIRSLLKNQLIWTMPPWITVVALPFMVVLAPETSALAVPAALKAV